MVRLRFWIPGKCGVTLYYHYYLVYFDPVVVPVKVPSIVQIDLFDNYLYQIGILDTIYVHIIYNMYQEDLALNKLQGLIYHKTQLNQIDTM